MTTGKIHLTKLMGLKEIGLICAVQLMGNLSVFDYQGQETLESTWCSKDISTAETDLLTIGMDE